MREKIISDFNDGGSGKRGNASEYKLKFEMSRIAQWSAQSHKLGAAELLREVKTQQKS